MMDAIVSPTGFFTLISLFAAGGIGALMLNKRDALANRWNSFFAIAGSIWGILFSLGAMYSSSALIFTSGVSALPLLELTFTIDKLAAFFVFVICLIAMLCSLYGFGYVKQYYQKYGLGTFGFFYQLFIIGMLLVVTSANALWFLMAWEMMSVASYFLVVYEHRDPNNVKAGLLYLIMTHIGTACIIFAFVVLGKYTGSYSFSAISAGSALIPAAVKNIVFLLLTIGLGTKAGIIPFHIWLPSAHPAAPSHVSGLMSGVMIKTGIYMMIRMFFDVLQPVPTWWGMTIVVIGAVSSLLGVLYALTEHDIKRLLAYHSIENIGIILLGLGASLTFLSLHVPMLAVLGLVAALFHVLNHATFKSLLFLGAGSVIHQAHTRNMEEYGGLIKLMPVTAIFFLVGSMAIAALPPFNGFFSEWLTFQSLFQGMARSNFSTQWVFIVGAGALAFTGGLALACFVKAFGLTFLARPRSEEVHQAKESARPLLFGMGGLALLAFILGIFSGPVVTRLNMIVGDLHIFTHASSSVTVSSTQQITVDHFSSVSALAFTGLALFLGLAVWFVVTKLIRKEQRIRVGATWDGGTDLTPRMEITATGFSRSIITIFSSVLKPSMQHDIEYHDDQMRYLPKSRTVTLNVSDVYRTYLYTPLTKVLTVTSDWVKRVQSGNINAYLLYMFLALLVAILCVR